MGPAFAVIAESDNDLRWLKELALAGLASRQPLRFVVFSDGPADQALVRTGMVTFVNRPTLDFAADIFAAFGCSMSIVSFGSSLRPGQLLSLASLAPRPCFVDRDDALGLLSRSPGDLAAINLREIKDLHENAVGCLCSILYQLANSVLSEHAT